MAEKLDCDGDDGRSYNSKMDCGDYQKDNWWLRNWIAMEMTEGDIIQGWIVVNIRKIIGGGGGGGGGGLGNGVIEK